MRRSVVFVVCVVVCLALALSLSVAAMAASARSNAVRTDVEKIIEAASRGDVPMIQRMLKMNPSMANAEDKDGAAPLHWAVDKGQMAAAKVLIEGKADINAKKKDGVTPLHIAAARGHKALVELLLEKEADANAKDEVLRTPMTVAKINGHEKVVELLAQHTAQSAQPDEKKPEVAEAAPLPAPKPVKRTPPELVAMAKKMVLNMEKGEFGEVYAAFDDKMRSLMTQEQLKQIWDALIAKEGAMKKISDSSAQNIELNGERYDIVVVSCDFPKRWRNFQVTINSERQISGLFLLPSGAMDD